MRRNRPVVLVLPGLGGSDMSTVALRSGLALAGYSAHGWKRGVNEGPTTTILQGVADRFRQLVERHQRPIALVGWSLGGVYAWHLARQNGDEVHSAIALGSPLRSMISGSMQLSVPATSIWTRNDEIVPWKNSVIDEQARQENIEVLGTHFTMGFDPLVIAAVVDRVAQDPDNWRPFDPPALLRGAYGSSPPPTDRP